MPPATSRPVAGHITQRSTSANVCSATIPFRTSSGGAMTHESTMPSPIESAMRRPTSIREPNESRLTSVPMRSAAPWVRTRAAAGRSFHGPSRKNATIALAPIPAPSAATRGPACFGPSSSTSSISPAAVPSANTSFSSSMK